MRDMIKLGGSIVLQIESELYHAIMSLNNVSCRFLFTFIIPRNLFNVALKCHHAYALFKCVSDSRL